MISCLADARQTEMNEVDVSQMQINSGKNWRSFLSCEHIHPLTYVVSTYVILHLRHLWPDPLHYPFTDEAQTDLFKDPVRTSQ